MHCANSKWLTPTSGLSRGSDQAQDYILPEEVRSAMLERTADKMHDQNSNVAQASQQKLQKHFHMCNYLTDNVWVLIEKDTLICCLQASSPAPTQKELQLVAAQSLGTAASASDFTAKAFSILIDIHFVRKLRRPPLLVLRLSARTPTNHECL
jgi:hypothetical protein